MADVPAEIGYGKVIGRFVSFTADSADGGDVPDEIPLTGSVVINPVTTVMRWPTVDPPRLAIATTLDCPVIDGDLYPPDADGTGESGVYLVATDQPEALPNLIQWRATFRLDGVATQPNPVVFNVPTGGEVDLALMVSVPPEQPAIIIVSAEAAADAAMSAEEAEAAALAAQVAQAGAELALSGAEAAASGADDALAGAAAASAAASDSAAASADSANAAFISAGHAETARSGAEAAQTAAANSATSAAGSVTAAANSASSASASASVLASGKGVIVLSANATVPVGTPIGTIVLRTAT